MTSPRDSLPPPDSSSGNPKRPPDQNDPTVGDQTMIERNQGPVDPEAKTDPGDAGHDPLQRGPARSVATVADFMESISLSGLMSREELEKIQDELSEADDPKTFADTLVRQRKLTTYQASVLQRGHVRGLVIGNYEVLDRIGHGGMGVVYRARHRRMRREVALKILPSAVTGKAEGVDRFTREVQAAARLQHPNICSAFDADVQNNLHYLAMELVDGPNLSGYVKEAGPLPVAVAVQLILQTVHGLQYAHAQGVVHRDIKPGNLLVNRDGVLKILDMGLAQFSGNADDPNHAELTQSGRIMGTVDYMAPEQAVDAKSVDHRADIYSVGCTLYYLLAGEPMSPPGPLTKKLLWHQNSPPPSLRGVRPEVPLRLDEIYLKMVAKSPDERQQTMGEVADDLESVLAELSYSDLQLPLVGIMLNTSPGSGSNSSRPSMANPLLLASDSNNSSSQTVSMAPKANSRFTAAHWAALACSAAALIALAIFFASGWNQPHEPAVTTPHGNGSTDPSEPDSPPPANASAEASFPILRTTDLNGGKLYIDGELTEPFKIDEQQNNVHFFPISLGEHWVKIVRADGVPFQKKVDIGPQGEFIHPTFAATAISRHAELLEWIFQQQGAIDVSFENSAEPTRFARSSDELAKPFRLLSVDLDNRPIGDQDLPRLLSASEEIERLSLAHTNVTDAGVELLQQLPRLQSLNLSHTAITPAAVEHLTRLSQLKRLDLAHTTVDDAVAANLVALPKLESLDLAGTQITSLGAMQLSALKHLTSLELHNTMVTADAYEHLRQRDSLSIAGVPDVDREVAEMVHQAGGEVTIRYLGEEESQTLTPQQPVLPQRFSIQAIDLRKASSQGDSLLTRFLSLKQLKTVYLGHGDYTLRGLAVLGRVKGLETLNIGELRFAEGTAALESDIAPAVVVKEEPAAVIVARWALSNGGEIAIRNGSSTRKIAALDAVPKQSFELVAVKGGPESKMSEDQLAALTKLARLESLALAGSSLSGSELARAASCAALVELDLSGTAANSGTIAALEKLPELRILRLNGVRLAAAELGGLTHLDQLEELALGTSSLSAELLTNWSPPANLKRLDLSGNQGLDDSAVSSLATFGKLERLDLTGTSLTDAAREELVLALKGVEVKVDPLDAQRLAARWFLENDGVVTINGGSISNKRQLPRTACVVTAVDLHFAAKQLPIADLATHLGNCPSLLEANLSGQSIGDSVLGALLKSSGMHTLQLSGSSLSDAGFRELRRFSKLQQLDVSGNLGIRGSSLAMLAHMTQLEELNLSSLPLTDADLAPLSHLKKLRRLRLATTHVGDRGLEHLKGLPLERLGLHATKVSDAGLASISQLKLSELDLSNTAVSDTGLSTLAKMKSLQRLDLSQTRATPAGVESLKAALAKCEIIVRAYRREEDANQVPYSGGVFGGTSTAPPLR